MLAGEEAENDGYRHLHITRNAERAKLRYATRVMDKGKKRLEKTKQVR